MTTLLENYYINNGERTAGNSLMILVDNLHKAEKKLEQMKKEQSKFYTIEVTDSGFIPAIDKDLAEELKAHLAEIDRQRAHIAILQGKVNRISNLINQSGEVIPDLQIYITKISGMKNTMKKLEFRINKLDYYMRTDPKLPRREAHQKELESWADELYQMHDKFDPEIEKLEKLINDISGVLNEDNRLGVEPIVISHDNGQVEEHNVGRINVLPRVGPQPAEGSDETHVEYYKMVNGQPVKIAGGE